MSKVWKLAGSVFVAIDVFIFTYLTLSQLRFMIFGQGQIPGGGSAIDMAIFLLPLFLAWVAGDRLYYFLSHKERRSKLPQTSLATETNSESAAPNASSIWDDDDWEETRLKKD